MLGEETATSHYTMKKWRSLLGSMDLKAKRWQKAKCLEQKNVTTAIEWILDQWKKGDPADHAEAYQCAYDRFKLKEKLSSSKFLKLVKERAYTEYPSKIRGIKKPPAL